MSIIAVDAIRAVLSQPSEQWTSTLLPSVDTKFMTLIEEFNRLRRCLSHSEASTAVIQLSSRLRAPEGWQQL